VQENNELLTYSQEEVEQLITMTEELQTENEQQREEIRQLHRQLQQAEQTNNQTQKQSSELRTALSRIQILTEKLLEQQEQTQILLSENQKLQSQVQKLTDRNENLQNSDEQLRNAKELKKQAKEQERQNAIEADRAKREANTAIAVAKRKEDEAQRAIKTAEQMKEQQKSIIRERANKLQDQFLNKWWTAAAVLIAYSVMVTVLTALKSERCIFDITTAGKLICKIFFAILNVIDKLATSAGSVGTHIQQPIVSSIVTYLLIILVGAICMLAIFAGLYFGGKKLVSCYKTYCWDEISPLVALISLAVLVWGAELMPLNIVLLFVITQIIYIAIRWYIGKES
jgi:hypothetical protein